MADAAQVLQAARAKGWRIATAESCTGGLIAGALTEIAGSSDVVECGFVTYSNAAKQKMLGVTETSLEAHGAVSEQVAREMVLGALRASGVELAVSVTGIAGPGGSEVKPEGMVCFGVATARGVVTETVQFGALGRSEVRQATVSHALKLLHSALS
ncbi:nicotinamide-nucleotide amidase [Litoreibacter meonggei]|uniref:Nicotinamide-nucleotide amidase n=1 Tax=Litoreibacter meonggei TaxID=1049199 RepID=A0A497VED8_9RHOB|nr:CinA family protein [Litoreibacter meonggei]RLJ41810.1 nicotinamide-nucleotide amidase [Litoreibacter meonggei]